MSEKNLIIPQLLDLYGSLLTEKQRMLTAYYYCDDLSLGEIAENENISRQGARDSIKKACAILLDFEDKLNLHLLAEQAAANNSIITALCNKIISGENIKENAKTIIDIIDSER